MQRHLLLFAVLLILSISGLRAQENVGIGTTTPNDFAVLHLESSDQGLLVPRLTTAEATAMTLGTTEEGIFIYNTDAGLFWYWDGAAWVPFPGGGGGGTDDQNLTGATLSGTTLTIDIEDGASVAVDLNALQDGTGSDDQDLTSASLSGTVLTVDIEDGSSISVDLAALQDGTGTDDQTLSFDNATGQLSISNGNTVTIPLSSGGDNWGSQVAQTDASLSGDGTSANPLSVSGTLTDDQDLTSASLSGTTLTIDIEDGASVSVDLNALQDGTGSDDQDLTGASLSGTTLTVDIENGTSASVDLSALQDGTGTDDQQLQPLGFDAATNVLTVALENGGTQTIDLSDLQDTGGSDDQNLTGASLAGTTLTMDIENGTSASVDLSALQDGTGTDDQQLQPLGFDAATNVLTVALENGGNQTIDLSDLQDAGGSDDQNLTGASLSGSTLTIDIEDGGSTNADLSALNNVDDVVAGAGLTGGGTASIVTLDARANNGLNVDAGADRIQLGGPLVENTTIAHGGFQMVHDLTGSGDLDIRDNGTSMMFFRDNGDIGIGTTAPTNFITYQRTGTVGEWQTDWVNDGIEDAIMRVRNTLAGNGSRVLLGSTEYNGTTSDATGVMGLALNNAGGARGVFGFSNSDAGFGVEGGFSGGTSLAAAGWGMFSDGWAGGTTAWQNVSDARLKTNVATIDGALGTVLRLRGVTYDFREDNFAELNVGGEQTGFIAQEVEAVLPHLVREANVPASPGTMTDDQRSEQPTPETVKTMSYSSIVPYLVEAIKEQQAVIEALEERIRALEAGE